jgi:hypothetical protein
MGNRHVHKIECLQTLGTSESERQKVTALNLFYPTASPPFAKGRFFGIATQHLEGGINGHNIQGKYHTGKPPPLGRKASLLHQLPPPPPPNPPPEDPPPREPPPPLPPLPRGAENMAEERFEVTDWIEWEKV